MSVLSYNYGIKQQEVLHMYVLRRIAEYAVPIVRLLLLMFILVFAVRFFDERRRRVKNAFDERQILNRLKAYRLAFFSMLITSLFHIIHSLYIL